MSALGTTPGPWEASLDDVPYAEFDGVAWQVNSDEGSICTIDSPAVIAEANAHLIAAAPELYEALAGLMSCIGGEEETVACIKAERALAKAKGGQP